jgi:two-component sensor histidine kinase
MEGPDLLLPPDLPLPLSLVIHELATNTTKYGSLSVNAGTVAIHWQVMDSRNLEWKEGGGPVVLTPTRKGFGSVLIERAFPSKADPEAVQISAPKDWSLRSRSRRNRDGYRAFRNMGPVLMGRFL